MDSCEHVYVVTEWSRRMAFNMGVWGGPAVEMTCTRCLDRVRREEKVRKNGDVREEYVENWS